MKKRLFIKLIAVILVIVTLFSTAALTISAASDTSVTVASETKVHGNTGQRRPYTKNLEEINKKLDALTPKEKKWFKDSVKELASAKTADKAVGSIINAMFALASDSDNISKKNVALETGATLINLAASCFGFGGIAEAITGGLLSIFKDKSPSEIQLLKDHLDNQFAIVNEGIYDIRNDISDLSIDIDQSFIEAITEVETAIEAQTAGNNVRAFTSSDNGYFNYNLLKNYLYGNSTDEKNEWASYAYYDKLSRAIAEKKSDAVIEEYYNALYKSLMTSGYERDPYINIMRQYIMDDGYAIYSIQHYYYDWLSYNRDVVQKKGKDAEWEAILFTLDVYRTMLGAEHCVLVCNNYFLSQIYSEYGPNPDGEASYEYVNADGSKTIIKYSDLLTDVARLNSEVREKELLNQIVQDIIYILNMENSYTLESIDGDFYNVNNVDSSTFGQVRTGQTIYMNRLSDEICEMFGLDPQKFVYKWSTGETNTGMLTVPENCEILTATLYYDGTEFYSIAFQINNDNTFCGGNGTASDPFLISTVNQFNQIKTGEESYDNKTGSMYYTIINDIDFGNIVRSPFGNKDNPFNGVLNGDGHTLKNITISTQDDVLCTALFAKLGATGHIENVTIENANFICTGSGTGTVYVGGITGQNEGTIDNCHLINTSIKVDRVCSSKSSSPHSYVGGISGMNMGTISNCSIISSEISGKSTNKKSFEGIYLGGVVGTLKENGTISNIVIQEGCKLYGNTDDIEGTRLGLIAGLCGNEKNIQNTYVSTSTDICFVYYGAPINNIDTYFSILGKPQYLLHDKNDIAFQQFDYIASGFYDGIVDVNYNYNENQIYAYNEDFLKTTETYIEDGVEKERTILNLAVDGNDGFSLDSYKILGYYGFDTLSSDKIDGEEHLVTVIFDATLKKEGGENKNVILGVDIPIVVEKIKPIELVIIEKPKTNYSNIGDLITKDDGVFELHWEDGSIDSGINPQIVSNKNTTDWGTAKVEISYKGVSATYEINVICSDHTYEHIQTEATCFREGYTKHTCTKCGDYYVDSIVNVIPHTIIIQNATAATCNTNGIGYTGDKYCTVCEKIVEYGTDIDVLQHSYEKIDDTHCKCGVCKAQNTIAPHTYKSVENEKYIYYVCTKCGYEPSPIPKATSANVSHIVVGQSYGLVDRDYEITVYVKMFNNPGITGLNLRIEYDQRLDFVRAEKGDILKSSGTFEPAHAKGVIGIVSADAYATTEDGNLLKLVFKLPKDAKVTDKYPILISYGNEFTDSNADLISLVTADGYIKAVSHLPGDINSDEVVDMLDTTLLARYMAIRNTGDSELMNSFLESQHYNFSEFYADVDLDGYVNLPDLVIMLQYLVGNNTQELTSNEFEVILNPNNGSLDVESIIVKSYDENGNFGVYPELPTPSRPGYRFEGWYTSFDALDPKTVQVKSGDRVKYNPTFLYQTLYARWSEITSYNVIFDANGGSGTMQPSVHIHDTEKQLPNVEFTKTGYHFAGWNTKADGSGTNYTNKASILNLVDQGNGSITLYAQWKAHSYTIQFNSNKPSTSSGQIVGTMNNLNCTYDVNASLGNAQYSLTGWTFKGWATSANGTVVYTNNATINNLTSVDGQIITLYAVWEANEYIIAFNANKPSNASGTVQGSMSNLNVKYDSTLKLPTNNFALTGWTFMGWATSSNGAVVYKDAASVINLSSVDGNTINLYAVWKANTYTIIYSANTGSGTMTSSTHTYDISTSLNTNKYNKTGYSFIGWNTSPDGKGTYYSNGASVKNLCNGQNGSITLYAIWGINQYTISFVTNGGNAIDTLIYNYGDFTAAPSNPTRAGYDFAGWTFDDANFAFGNEMPTHNIVATANWTYKSTYYDSGYEAKKIDASYTYDYDSFDISDLAPFMQEGYKLQFSVAVYMWEEDEGYQEIYLRNSNGSNIAGNSEFAHGGSGKDGAWWEYFTFTVDGESCTNTMYLRYGAHGKSSDDWYRGRAEVTVTVIEE